MNYLKISVDWLAKEARYWNNKGARLVFPSFFEADIMPMRIQLIEPDTTNSDKWIAVANEDLALYAALTSEDGATLLADQGTWTKNASDNSFTGTLNLSGSDLNTWLSTSASKTALFGLRVTGTGGDITTILKEQVTVKSTITGAAGTGVSPGLTALSLEIARQLFVPKQGEAGGTITLLSQDGTRSTILYTDNDGSFHSDAI